MNQFTAFAAVVVAAALGIRVCSAETSFTYQGELKANGSLAAGSFDMDFLLWDADSGGNQIGLTLSLTQVVVVEGKFTVDLDFGADAFDNGARWLEIAVDQTTLSPRHPITRSPYSIQTRGIFVDEDENVGIGTLAPNFPLHVESTTKSPIFAHYDGNIGGTYAISGNKANGIAGGGVNGYASAPSGFTVGVQGRSESTTGTGVRGVAAAATGLNYGVFGETNSPNGYAGYFLGRGYFSDDVEMDGRLKLADGITFLSNSFSPMAYMFDTGGASTDRMVLAHSPSFFNWGLEFHNTADDFAFVGSGIDRVRIDLNGSDVTPASGGTLVISDTSGTNIAIDDNEIMARNNGSTSTLHLNADGGQINMGLYDIKPPLAYGRINSNGTIASASANVTGVTHFATGKYIISLAGGVASSDIILVQGNNIQSLRSAAAEVYEGEIWVWFWSIEGSQYADGPFSFIIYRH